MATITKDLGVATAYGYHKAGGGTLTEGEFEQKMVDITTAVDDAEAARDAASSSASSAAQSATELAETVEQVATNTADIADIRGELDDSDNLTVGSSKQLLSTKYDLDQSPYHFRVSGGNGADRCEEMVVGGSVVWNQGVKNGDFSNGTSSWQYSSAAGTSSFTVTDGVATVVGTKPRIAQKFSGETGHKYIISAELRASYGAEYRCGFGSTSGGGTNSLYITLPSNEWVKAKVIIISNVNAWIFVGRTNNNTDFSEEVTLEVKNYQVFDLTTMFGSTIADYLYNLERTTAGAGVAIFKQMFPEDYYEYNAGEIKSVEGVSAKETVGFNLWDEEWETGGIASGNPSSDSSRIRSKNYTPCFPNTKYCKFCEDGLVINIFWYDADKTYLTYVTASSNVVVTSPSNAQYFKICTTTTYGGTYKNNICINLSDPAKNGTYEPYVKHSYPLDSTLTLRGIPKLSGDQIYFDGDTYEADGTVTRRYGIVDLGTLTYTLTGSGLFSTAGLRGVIRPSKSNSSIDGITFSIYTEVASGPHAGPSGSSPSPDMTVSINQGGTVYLNNLAYTDVTEFKTAMSGVYLVCELKTPTTETAAPYTNPQILSEGGTEEFVTTGIVPVGHYTKYFSNLRKKIEGLPWNFASLIAPTESTYTATRNYTTGDLFIVDNILYKATANIANGGTITPNSNCTATTLAEIISALS